MTRLERKAQKQADERQRLSDQIGAVKGDLAKQEVRIESPGCPMWELGPVRGRGVTFFLRSHDKTRSSAQGNCSAKSLASVMSSILPCPPCLLRRGGVQWERGRGVQQGRGRGQGTFHPPCHVLHYHMVLRPEGTSHN